MPVSLRKPQPQKGISRATGIQRAIEKPITPITASASRAPNERFLAGMISCKAGNTVPEKPQGTTVASSSPTPVCRVQDEGPSQLLSPRLEERKVTFTGPCGSVGTV